MRSKELRPEQRSLFDPEPEAEVRPQDQADATSEEASTSSQANLSMPSLFPEDKPPPARARIAPQPPRALTSGFAARWADVNELADLKTNVLACGLCPLRGGARGVVFGEGDPHAGIMLVGEGPGQTEDETGRPFVGRAGQLLDQTLRAVGFERRQVFIANIVKCRPPENRLPLLQEVEACLPNLEAQIRIINPRIIVLLGAMSSQTLVDPSIRVTRDRGKWFEKDGRSYLVAFHPAAVLRDELGKKKLLLDDFKSLQARWEQVQRGILHGPH